MPSRLCLLLAVLVVPITALSATPKPTSAAKPKKKKPEFEHLDAWADEMTYFSKESKFHFKGKAVVIRGDLRVNCDEMIGYLEPPAPPKKTEPGAVKAERAPTQLQITKVTALGNVQMITVKAIEPGKPPAEEGKSKAWRGGCSRADYDVRTREMIMTSPPGERRPWLRRPDLYCEANKITLYPDTGKYLLDGEPIVRGDIESGP